MANNPQATVTSNKEPSLIDLNNLYFPDGLILSSPFKQTKTGISTIGDKGAQSIEYEHLIHFYINETKTTTGINPNLLGMSTDGVAPRSEQGKKNPIASVLSGTGQATPVQAGSQQGGVGGGFKTGSQTGTGFLGATADWFSKGVKKAEDAISESKVIRTKTTISLPMPQNIGTTYINNWNVEANDLNAWQDTAKMIGAQVDVKLRSVMTNTMKAATGKSIAVQSAMTYQGPQYRSFQFQWDFYPTTPSESKRLWAILQMFKWCSLPELVDQGRFYHVPNTFDIEYRYKGKRNDFLPMTSTCALTSMSVVYTPVGHWAAFDPFEPNTLGDPVKHAILEGLEGAPPVGITLALDFTELSLLTKNLIDPKLNLTFNTTAFESGSAVQNAKDRGYY